MKNNSTTFANWLVNLGLRCIILLARILPYGTRLAFCGWATRTIIGPIAGWDKRAIANLSMIWPEKDQGTLHRIASASLDNIGRCFIENYSPKDLARHMQSHELTGPGVECVLNTIAEQKTVILVSAHFGNYEAPRAALGMRDMPVGMIYRRADNEFFQRHYAKTLDQINGPMFAKGEGGTKAFMNYLAEGNAGVLLFDVFVSKGELIDFMGKPAKTATTAAWLAMTHEAPLVPFYGIRKPDGVNFELVFEDPIEHSNPTDMTRALNKSLEARIEANPGQWLWPHRRWKARI